MAFRIKYRTYDASRNDGPVEAVHPVSMSGSIHDMARSLEQERSAPTQAPQSIPSQAPQQSSQPVHSLHTPVSLIPPSLPQATPSQAQATPPQAPQTLPSLPQATPSLPQAQSTHLQAHPNQSSLPPVSQPPALTPEILSLISQQRGPKGDIGPIGPPGPPGPAGEQGPSGKTVVQTHKTVLYNNKVILSSEPAQLVLFPYNGLTQKLHSVTLCLQTQGNCTFKLLRYDNKELLAEISVPKLGQTVLEWTQFMNIPQSLTMLEIVGWSSETDSSPTGLSTNQFLACEINM